LTLANLISNPQSAEPLIINKTYNTFILNKISGLIVANDTKPKTLYDSLPKYCNLTLLGDKPQYFWNFECYHSSLTDSSIFNKTGPYFYFQSSNIQEDLIFSSFISSLGIVAFYTTFVLAVGRLLRGYTSGLIVRIFYEDLEDVDLLLYFVKDIYNSRRYRDFKLELNMFEHLLKIYSDQRLLQLWTQKAKYNVK
jgi:hypothetical protein